MTDRVSQISIDLYNLNGDEIENFKSQFIYDKQKVLLISEFGQVQINLMANTNIKISFPEFNFIKSFNVVFV